MLSELESNRKEELIWTVCLILLQLLVIASTIFRLIYRKRNQGLWWDDHFVLISLVFAVISFVSPWLALTQAHPTLHIVSGWLFVLSFSTLIWTGRISLALSTARIMPRQHPIFSLVLFLVFLFGALYLALIIVSIVACARDTAWTLGPPYVYVPSHSLAIFILCGDLVGDILLIAIPLRLFWDAKLQPIELFLVKIGFAASILTSASSIICTVFLLTHVNSGGNWEIIQAGLTHIMVCISLMACNALVIITFFYRYLRRRKGEQPSTLDNEQVTNGRDVPTYPSEPITSSNQETSIVLTEISDMIGDRHTFSCD